MVNYIKEIANEIVKRRIHEDPGIIGLYVVLAEELDRLDPRDFLPDVQYKFVIARLEARKIAERNPRNISQSQSYPFFKNKAREILYCLEKYMGEGSRAEIRPFDFISDPYLREIIKRDYEELSLILFPGMAWKSCVIMSGSILEAILFDVLTADQKLKSKAISSSKAPKYNNGKVKHIDKDEWHLINLIEVSVDIGILPEARARSIDQVLRDYRNFVHPKKEIKSQHPCTEAEAFMAKGSLDGVCNFLEENLQTKITSPKK